VNLYQRRAHLRAEMIALPAGPGRAAVEACLRGVERELMLQEVRRDRYNARSSRSA
jgi:hypothetical protein